MDLYLFMSLHFVTPLGSSILLCNVKTNLKIYGRTNKIETGTRTPCAF